MANTIWRLPYSAQQLEDAVSNHAPRISENTGNWECWDINTSDWADTGVPAAGKNPYIGNDSYWYVWDHTTNQYVKTNYSVAQSSVVAVNGITADPGGNVNVPWTSITGSNPISKGGTGKSTAPSGLRALIDGCSALTDSTLSISDLFPLLDASDSKNAKKITLENLISFLGSNSTFAKIQQGSYVGTGTYGESNPTSITFDFPPKIVFSGKSQIDITNLNIGVDSTTYYTYGILLTSMLTTTYQQNFGFSSRSTSSTTPNSNAKKSVDGKTISWYNVGAGSQNNKSGTTYYWVAIG